MQEKPLNEMTTGELLADMRKYGDAGDMRYRARQAELDRRIAKAQFHAATAQIRSAWFQLAAIVAMFLTVLTTFAAPFWPADSPELRSRDFRA
jgi:hypothetical protein